MSKGTSTPGPGQYSIDQRPRTAGGAFGVKTGSSLGINPQTAAKVGPGAYDLSGVSKHQNNTKDKGFGTTLGGRSLGISSCAPGPGQYSIDVGIDAGHTFGTSKRDSKSKYGTPGPGQYT